MSFTRITPPTHAERTCCSEAQLNEHTSPHRVPLGTVMRCDECLTRYVTVEGTDMYGDPAGQFWAEKTRCDCIEMTCSPEIHCCRLCRHR